MRKEDHESCYNIANFEGSDLNVNIDFDDVMFFVGVALITIGLWIVNPAISLIATGVIFMSVGWLRAGED